MNLEKLNARRCAAVTPDDINPLSFDAFALFIGVGGDVKITNPFGDTVTFLNLPSGSVLNVHARIVFANGTDATDIVALA